MFKKAFFLVLLLCLTVAQADDTQAPQAAQASVNATTASAVQTKWCKNHEGKVSMKDGAPICDISWVDKDSTGKITLGKIPPSYIVQHGHIHYQNGLVCKGCSLIVAKDMSLAIVIDRKGYQWPSEGITAIDNHPYIRSYAQAAAVGAQQYGSQMQQNAQRQMMMNQLNKPLNVNCTSMPTGYSYTTNCTSY